MNKFKKITHLMITLVVANVAQAEYHVVQPGEVLSVIAEQKRVQSGFMLSTEQIMLTLYQLNKNVFINGDIDQLVVNSKIFIPDDTSEYIKLSKAEAIQRLRDKGYTQSMSSDRADVENKASANDVVKGNKNDYAEILERLDDHQQTIDHLQVENKRLNTKFNLLEKALGRVVLVQGLLTNDLVQVKQKLMGESGYKPEVHEDKNGGDSGLLDLDHQINNSPVINSASDLTRIAAEKKMESAKPVLPVKHDEVGLQPHAQKIEVKVEQTKLEHPSISTEIQPVSPIVDSKPLPATTEIPEPILKPLSHAGATVSVARKVMAGHEEGSDSWFLKGAMIIGLFVAILAAWWGARFYKLRLVRAAMASEGDFKSEDEAAHTSTFVFDDSFEGKAVKSDLDSPVKSIIEKSQKAVKALDHESGLDEVMDLLDMCLLCGDYEQAHKVTLKALAENNASAVLKKKLSFIERKMAKL